MKVKVRTVGNSTTITIPKEFNVVPGTEFDVEQGKDGSIIFKPKHRNPFEGDWFTIDLKQVDISSNAEDFDNEWY